MSLEKVQVPSQRPIYPTPAGLVTTVDGDGNPNIITLGEIYNLSIRKPVIVGLGIAPERYSHQLLCGCREFVVNLPTSALLDKVLACGNVSGRDVRDKFARAGLTPLPSATPANRFFAFSHVLDGGWTGHHYDRSWELLGLNAFGSIVNVDHATPPFGNTRRLVTAADVKNDARRAHSSVVPGGAAAKDASGRFVHEDLWRCLFTHPVEQVGAPVPHDPGRPKPRVNAPQTSLTDCALP